MTAAIDACSCADGECATGWAVYTTRCRACGYRSVDVAPACADREHLECAACGAQDSHTRLLPADIPSVFASALPYPDPADDV